MKDTSDRSEGVCWLPETPPILRHIILNNDAKAELNGTTNFTTLMQLWIFPSCLAYVH